MTLGFSNALRFAEMGRCLDPEILDSDGVPEPAVARAYRELSMLHDWLGNTSAILKRLKAPIVGGHKEPARASVLDIGCGQGALLAKIQRKLGMEIIGFDLRPSPLSGAIPIHTGNAVTDPLPSADVAICVVMAHHLSEADVAGLVENVARSCQRLILLDLVRHPIPLALFRAFVCPFLGRINRLDGQTSIRRAYTAKEMGAIVGRGLAASGRPVQHLRHTVGPLWIRQIMDITWATPTSS